MSQSIITVSDNTEGSLFEYHPKVAERLREMITRLQNKLEACTPDELKGLQASIKLMRDVLAVPAIIVREIEEGKRNG